MRILAVIFTIGFALQLSAFNKDFEKIYNAVKNDELTWLKTLIKCYTNKETLPNFINMRHHESGLGVLHRALSNKNINYAIIRVLLKAGADTNLALLENCGEKGVGIGRMYKGWTSVHFAVRARVSKPIFELLYNYEADFSRKDTSWTPIGLAFTENNHTFIEFHDEKFSCEMKDKE